MPSPKGEAQLLKEFRDFIMRGNVIDLAVGIVIGAAFGSVADLQFPTLGIKITYAEGTEF